MYWASPPVAFDDAPRVCGQKAMNHSRIETEPELWFVKKSLEDKGIKNAWIALRKIEPFQNAKSPFSSPCYVRDPKTVLQKLQFTVGDADTTPLMKIIDSFYFEICLDMCVRIVASQSSRYHIFDGGCSVKYPALCDSKWLTYFSENFGTLSDLISFQLR